MKVLISKVKIDENSRLRATSGDNIEDLVDSIKELGQLVPIIINEYYKLIAGYRRLKAANQLEWTHIDAVQMKGLTPLAEFDVELHENWKRENFTSQELGDALLKREEIYKAAHPEATVEGRHMKRVREADGTLGESLTKKPETGLLVGTKNSRMEPAKSFAESTSKILGVSVTTIKDKLQVARARKDKTIPEEVIKSYDEGKTSFTKVLEVIREKGRQAKTKEKTMVELRKERKELGLKFALEDEVDDIVEAVNNVRKEENIEPIEVCLNCMKNIPVKCTDCDHVFFLCERDWTDHEIDQEACKKFEK